VFDAESADELTDAPTAVCVALSVNGRVTGL